MPIIAAVIGAILSGLLYWFRSGDGLAHLDRFLHDRRAAKRRAENEAAYRLAPIRALREPIDAAGVLMYLVARARGTPTPEQVAVIEAEMRAIVPPGDSLADRMACIRHAADRAADTEFAVRHLAPLLRDRLTLTERAELERMLAAVAAVHQGPVSAQDSLLAAVNRHLNLQD